MELIQADASSVHINNQTILEETLCKILSCFSEILQKMTWLNVHQVSACLVYSLLGRKLKKQQEKEVAVPLPAAPGIESIRNDSKIASGFFFYYINRLWIKKTSKTEVHDQVGKSHTAGHVTSMDASLIQTDRVRSPQKKPLLPSLICKTRSSCVVAYHKPTGILLATC